MNIDNIVINHFAFNSWNGCPSLHNCQYFRKLFFLDRFATFNYHLFLCLPVPHIGSLINELTQYL